jgi:integrase
MLFFIKKKKEGFYMAGSIVDLSNNKWELRVSLGYDMNGKQIRKTKRITARSRQAADKELAKFYVQVTNQPVIAGTKITFGEFVSLWAERYGNKLSNSTFTRSQTLLETRILPVFGRKQLSKISDTDILRFIENLREVGIRLDGKDDQTLSDGSVQMHYKLLRSILNKAVQWKYLSQSPCSLIAKEDIPKPNYRQLPIWQEEDYQRFLQLLEKLDNTPVNVKHKLMVSLAALTGARRGEFMALTWDDIDFPNKRIHINKACEIIPHQKVGTKAPKTHSSIRWVGIDDYTIEFLDLHKALQDAYLREKQYTNPNQFIFIERKHTTKGIEVNRGFPTTFYNWLKKFCNENALPKIAVHSFRHMAGTYALAYGVPLTTVQYMLGHTDIKTTAIYLHELEAKRQEATNILSSQLNRFRKNITPPAE